MASLAARAQEMLESDAGFRAQFDRSSESYHGRGRSKEYLEPVPLNLPEALGLPGDGTAHVGLTAATGERWQAHDVTSWAVCDRPGRDAVP